MEKRLASVSMLLYGRNRFRPSLRIRAITIGRDEFLRSVGHLETIVRQKRLRDRFEDSRKTIR